MWFWYSLFFAIATSISISLSKRILKNMSPVLMAASGILSVPFFAFILFKTTSMISQVDNLFWLGVFASAFLNIFAGIFSLTAIKHAPISLIMPISAFNPVFTTIFAMITLGEIPNPTKSLGIIVIVIGTYLLNISDIKHSVWRPFISLFANRYVLMFLTANIIWAITPLFEKIAINHTAPKSPVLVAGTSSFLLTIFLIPVILKSVQSPLKEIKQNIHWFLLFAPLSALAAWAVFTAYSLTNLGYVTSVMKLSTLFTIVWGAVFFKEEKIRERLLGASVMVLGTLLLVI